MSASLVFHPLKSVLAFFLSLVFCKEWSMWVFFFLFWNSPRSFPLLLLSTKIKDRVLERNKNDEFSPFCNWGSRFGIQGCLGGSACLSLVSVLLNNLRMESEYWSLVKLLHHTLLRVMAPPHPSLCESCGAAVHSPQPLTIPPHQPYGLCLEWDSWVETHKDRR